MLNVVLWVVIGLVIAVILSGIAAYHNKVIVAGWLFCIITGLSVLTGIGHYNYSHTADNDCRTHVVLTPTIYNSDYLVNVGLKMCDQQYGFWNLTGN